MKTIVSVIPVEDEDKRLLEQAAPGYRLLFAQPREIPADGLRDAEVILGNVPRSVLREAIRLRWLQLNSAGADLYLQPGVLPEGVQLTSGKETVPAVIRVEKRPSKTFEYASEDVERVNLPDGMTAEILDDTVTLTVYGEDLSDLTDSDFTPIAGKGISGDTDRAAVRKG